LCKKGLLMKRLVLLAAALVLCGVVAMPAGAVTRPAGVVAPNAVAADAVARPSGATSTVVAAAALAKRGKPVTLRWLRNNLVGFSVGPRRPTGFGKSRLTGFTRGCPECRWYRVTNRLTNHQPKDPTSRSVRPATHRLAGFCWPWDDFPWSGDGCWNIMAGWDWGRILDILDYRPVWDPRSTIDRLVGCYHGVYQGLTSGVIGKQSVGILLEMADLVRVTPAGITYSVVGGCAFDLYHR
jgi:hypothetical protein